MAINRVDGRLRATNQAGLGWAGYSAVCTRYVLVLILFFSIVGQMKTRHDMPLCRGQSTRKIIPIMFLDIVEEKRGHAYYARYSNT